MSQAKYIIGIDLGTTNCTMAYASLEETSAIKQFPISQLASTGSQIENFSLPSFLYFPLEEELQSKQIALSWDPERHLVVGMMAQSRGTELPMRLISSAKSWLCHNGVNRREPFLPFSPESDIAKMSPLTACSQFLRHLKEAWNQAKNDPFEEQQILITVPASFDPNARQLVQEAAQQAGFPEIILLEEPQAAFYAWLHAHENDWRKILKIGDTILVIDIGGGTTDFSLIAVAEEQGDLALKRVAVGAHLLLGGDNIDLSLAHLAKSKFEDQGQNIDEWQFHSLIHSCRLAKEKLLSETPPKHFDISVMGRGSRLIGGSIKTKLTLEEIRTLILDGFAPLVGPQERSPVERRVGLQQIGLPYAKDPRFSCQLAQFLSMMGEKESNSMEYFTLPTAVLFNGGTTKAAAIRERLIAQLNLWAKELGRPSVRVLPDANYDFGVSQGAVYYGIARSGKGIRIRSGTSRSYFIGVEESAPAVPGFTPALKAICVAPFGMEEGTELTLEGQEFALLVGEPAVFRFFSHAAPLLSDGTTAIIGRLIKNHKQELTELHPIETLLDKHDGDGKTIRVNIHTKVTELGVLEVWCVAESGSKWKLEFDIRQDLAECKK